MEKNRTLADFYIYFSYTKMAPPGGDIKFVFHTFIQKKVAKFLSGAKKRP